jgi:hypothetical protein
MEDRLWHSLACALERVTAMTDGPLKTQALSADIYIEANMLPGDEDMPGRVRTGTQAETGALSATVRAAHIRVMLMAVFIAF